MMGGAFVLIERISDGGFEASGLPCVRWTDEMNFQKERGS
jgi:hypothetical protein